MWVTGLLIHCAPLFHWLIRFFIFVSWSQHGGALTLLQLSRRCFPSILRTCRRVLNESTLSHSFVPDKPCLNGKGIHCLPTKYLVIVIPQWNDLSGLQIPTSETCRKPKGHSLRGNLSSRLLLCLPHACVGHGSLLRLVSRQSEVQWFFCYPGMALGADYAHLIRSLLCSKMGRFQMFWGLLIWNVKLRCKKTCVNMMFGRSPMAFFWCRVLVGMADSRWKKSSRYNGNMFQLNYVFFIQKKLE